MILRKAEAIQVGDMIMVGNLHRITRRTELSGRVFLSLMPLSGTWPLPSKLMLEPGDMIQFVPPHGVEPLAALSPSPIPPRFDRAGSDMEVSEECHH
jgi:hypothetical protein